MTRIGKTSLALLTSLLAIGCGDSGGSGNSDGSGGSSTNASASGSGGSSSGGSSSGGSGGGNGTMGSGGGQGNSTSAGMAGEGGGGNAPVDGCTNLDSGWTEFSVGDETLVYYLSSSSGSDDNDGLSEDTAFATLPGAAEAIRAAAGAMRGEAAVVDAHLLLRRGDVFDEGFGNFTIHGASSERPFLVSSYGNADDPRPVVAGELFRTQGGGGVPNEMVTAHVAFVGLHLHATWRDPDSPEYQGAPDVATDDGVAAFSMLRSFEDLLLEDMVIESFSNIVVQVGNDSDTHPMGIDFRMRRSIVIDNYNNRAGGHSQGIFMKNVENALFEENVFDHNGWHADLAGAEATIFNHNFYIQSDCKDVVLRRNIIARASSHGFQLRPHGLAEENLLIANGIAGFVAGDNPYAGMLQALRGNVMVHAGQHSLWCDDCDNNETFRGWGLAMFLIDADLASAAEAVDNIAAHSGPTAQVAFDLEDAVTASGNIVYDWDGESDAGPFADPERDITTYHESLGGEPSVEAFLNGARSNSKGHWCEEYTAARVNQYIRDGFAAP